MVSQTGDINQNTYFSLVNAGKYAHMTDKELLAKYHIDDDNRWLGILLQRYTLLLLGVCMKYLKNEDDAKDSVQQIFLKVIEELQKYKVEYFKSWLYMVAKNHCLMKLRAQQGKYTQELKEETAIEQHETDRNDLLTNEKTYSLLEESVDELNLEQKQCVTLFYLEKKSYQQITEATGFNLMQVKSHIQNGKRNLKLSMEQKLKQKA